MRPRRSIVALLVVALCVTLGAFGRSRLAQAEGRAAAALSRLEAARRDAAEIRALRGRKETVASRERPAQDVIALVNATLDEVGIRSDRLKGIEPLSDEALSPSTAGRHRRQSVAATLEELTPPEIGRFLREWGARQPVWVPERIELYHVRDQPPPRRLYSARIVMSAVYLSDLPDEVPR